MVSPRQAAAHAVHSIARSMWTPLTAMLGLFGVALRDHRRLLAEIESRDSQLLTFLDGLPLAVMLRAQDGTLLHINPGGERFLERLGVGVWAVRQSPISLVDHVEVITEDGHPVGEIDLPVASAVRHGVSRDATLGYAIPGGGYVWYSVRAAPVPLNDGTTGTVVTLDDVTERHEARHLVAAAERSWRGTFDNAPIGIALSTPTGQIMQVNAALCDLLGYDEDSLVAAGLAGVSHPDELESARAQVAACLSGEIDRYLADRRLRHADGHWLHCQLSVALMRADDGSPLYLISQVVDLSARRSLEQELRAAATEDPLTGLVNRRALKQHLAEAQHRQARDGGEIGMLYVDLDDFKAVNDTFGHDAGDRVLIAAGRRLVRSTRQVDTVCRLGGDEFVVLCGPTGETGALADLVDRLAAMPPVAVRVGDTTVTVAASIGAVIVAPDEDLDQALRRADAEMYRAKRAARGKGSPD